LTIDGHRLGIDPALRPDDNKPGFYLHQIKVADQDPASGRLCRAKILMVKMI